MKVCVHEGGSLNTQKSYFTERGSSILKFASEYKLAVRFLSVLLTTALLMPLFFFR